ncbi:MAG: hypothetical protein M1836_001302 [Candelina mexicana]|nr:MAG: hypothetical protein M1836_001302 [Candelina mexicana]
MHVIQRPRAALFCQTPPPDTTIVGYTPSLTAIPDSWLHAQTTSKSKHNVYQAAPLFTHLKQTDLLDLPIELVRLVVEHMVIEAGLAKAVRLRLISRFFDREVLHTIFKDGIFDFPNGWHTARMSDLYITKLLFARGGVSRASKRNVISGAIDQAIRVLERLHGSLDQEQRLCHTHTLCEMMTAQQHTCSLLDYLDTGAEDLVKWTSKDSGLWDAIAVTASTGNIRELTKLIGSHTPSSAQEMGLCGLPTSVAAGYGQYATLQFLLDRDFMRYEEEHHDSQNSSKARYSLPALRRASLAGHEDIIRLLLAPKYGMPRCGKGYESAILAASRSGHMAILQMLINHVTDLTTTDILHRMMFIAAYNGRTKVVQMLLDAGISADISDEAADQPLKQAAIHGRTSVIRLLLPRIARSIDSNASAVEALVRAIRNRHMETAQVLLDAGTDINAKGWRSHVSPLSTASKNEDATMVLFLLKRGAVISNMLYDGFALRCSREGD